MGHTKLRHVITYLPQSIGIAVVFVLSVLVPICIEGQNPADDNRRKAPSVEEAERTRLKRAAVEDLILVARAQPFEISADLLLDLLSSDTVLDKRRKTELIEEIFHRASEAKEPNKMALSAGHVDTRAGYASYAYSLDLDSLSIRLRAVRVMLRVDRVRARELFQEIPPLRLKPLSCKEVLHYDVKSYYTLLKDIADNTFDGEAAMRLESTYFIAARLEEIASSAQLGAALDLVASYKSKQAEFSVLLDRLANSLRRISPDPRSLAGALRYDRLTEKVKFAVSGNRPSSNGETTEFVKAYRRFLAKNLSAAQCADSVITIVGDKEDPILSAANSLFEQPLTEDDVKPESVEARAEDFAYWRSPKAASILRGIRQLRFGGGNVELTRSEKSGQDWERQLAKFMEEFNNWSAADEQSELDFLHQKSVTFNSLIQIVPPGPARLDILRDFGLFLRNSSLQREEPLHWLFQVKLLIRTAYVLADGQREAFVDMLVGTGNNVFSAYVNLDKLKGVKSSKPASVGPSNRDL